MSDRSSLNVRTQSIVAALFLVLLASRQGRAEQLPPEATESPPATESPAAGPEATAIEPAPTSTADPATETASKRKDDGKWRRKGPVITGFVQAFYRYAFETGDDGLVDNDNFRVQRVRVKLRGKVYPWLGYKISIDPRAPEVGGILRDAYLSVKKVIPRHEIRIGQQKTQFGYENRQSSSRLFAVNRTEVSDNLSRGLTLRDIGIGLLGNVPIADRWRFEDAITLTNGAGFNVQDDNTDMKDVWGRVGVRYKNDDLWVGFGVSAAIGSTIEEGDLEFDPVDDFLFKYKRLGTDLEIDTKWFFASMEFVLGRNDGEGEVETINGWYINLVGKTPWPVGPVFRVDTEDDVYRRWMFGAYYGSKNDRFRLLVNYEYREIFDEARGDDKLYVWTQVRF